MSAAVNSSLEGERTKFKALVRYFHEGKQNALGKEPVPLDDAKVESLAKILEVSSTNKAATHPTRPDKRFPNQNQVNNCWCVAEKVGRLRRRPRWRLTRAHPPPPHLLPARPPRRQAINEYQVCVYQKGAQDAACLQRGRDYNTVCPLKWIEDWKAQAEEGRNLTVGKTFM